ncbi:MAG: hypothetical protein EZS28_045867, partial [Streblomastix strix]
DLSTIVATVEIVSQKNDNNENNKETTSTVYPISVKNITWMFDTTGRENQAETVRQMQTIINEPPYAPNVKVYLHFGSGLGTPISVKYKGKHSSEMEI